MNRKVESEATVNARAMKTALSAITRIPLTHVGKGARHGDLVHLRRIGASLELWRVWESSECTGVRYCIPEITPASADPEVTEAPFHATVELRYLGYAVRDVRTEKMVLRKSDRSLRFQDFCGEGFTTVPLCESTLYAAGELDYRLWGINQDDAQEAQASTLLSCEVTERFDALVKLCKRREIRNRPDSPTCRVHVQNILRRRRPQGPMRNSVRIEATDGWGLYRYEPPFEMPGPAAMLASDGICVSPRFFALISGLSRMRRNMPSGWLFSSRSWERGLRRGTMVQALCLRASRGPIDVFTCVDTGAKYPETQGFFDNDLLSFEATVWRSGLLNLIDRCKPEWEQNEKNRISVSVDRDPEDCFYLSARPRNLTTMPCKPGSIIQAARIEDDDKKLGFNAKLLRQMIEAMPANELRLVFPRNRYSALQVYDTSGECAAVLMPLQ